MKNKRTSAFFSMLLASMFAGSSTTPLGNKPPVTLHSHGSFHRKGKLKGWMKENKKCTFNKNR
jgi:hypothetical protein